MTPSPQNLEHRPHILVVDDEVDNRELLEIVLRHRGYFVTCASGGREALASIRDMPPDLVLLDLMMPHMNGYEVTVEIKSNPATQHIIVVLFSALNDGEVRRRAEAAGARALFGKPMSSADLCARLETHLPH